MARDPLMVAMSRGAEVEGAAVAAVAKVACVDCRMGARDRCDGSLWAHVKTPCDCTHPSHDELAAA